MTAEKIIIVDERSGIPIGLADRDTAHEHRLSHEHANVLLFDTRGDAIVTKRGEVAGYTDMWEATYGGHVSYKGDQKITNIRVFAQAVKQTVIDEGDQELGLTILVMEEASATGLLSMTNEVSTVMYLRRGSYTDAPSEKALHSWVTWYVGICFGEISYKDGSVIAHKTMTLDDLHHTLDTGENRQHEPMIFPASAYELLPCWPTLERISKELKNEPT